MRNVIRLVAALAISAASVVLVPDTALAECDGPIPDFRDVVPTASRVFIGDVMNVENPDSSGFGSRFTIRVRYVLKGRVHHWPLRISNVRGSPCAPVITASKGQRIALALDGKRPRPYPANSVAYITGQAPSDWIGSDPHLAADDVYRLAGVTLDERGYAPDTARITASGARSASNAPLLWAVFSSALAGAMWAWPARRRGRMSGDIPGQ